MFEQDFCCCHYMWAHPVPDLDPDFPSKERKDGEVLVLSRCSCSACTATSTNQWREWTPVPNPNHWIPPCHATILPVHGSDLPVTVFVVSLVFQQSCSAATTSFCQTLSLSVAAAWTALLAPKRLFGTFCCLNPFVINNNSNNYAIINNNYNNNNYI